MQSQQRDVWVFLKHDEEGVNPQMVLSRWATDEPPARTLLEQQLAASGAKTKKRRRKSG